MRQAMAGLIWGKQFYRYDLPLWLDGDEGAPPPPESRKHGRNAGWRHFDAYDILSMPDPWEYPWFAAWDLAFQTVALAHIAPAFAKYQLVLMCREWFMHPNGAIPAYEWAFDDVNPPVHAWAALEVFLIDGAKDYAFLERVFQKLLMNFTWWVNREDPEGNNVFQGGFLGLDNIGAVDRSHLPPGVRLDQTDGTAWMAFYALTMLRIGLYLNDKDEVYEDLVTKFFEHFVMITEGINDHGLWDPADGFFYDHLVADDGTRTPLRVKSLVGVIPVLAAIQVPAARTLPGTRLRKRFADFLSRRGIDEGSLDSLRLPPADARPRHRDAEHGRPRAACAGCSPRSSTRTGCSRRTASGRCPAGTSTSRSRSTSVGRPSRWATSRPSRRPRCTAGTPTGAGRCGSP